MADHPFPIDPALQAEEDAYKALSGIYPSRHQAQGPNPGQETRRESSSNSRLEDEGSGGYDERQHGQGPASGSGSGNVTGVKKKRRSAPAGGDDGVKKSRQSRESALAAYQPCEP
jgi:hypothetical protein